MGSLVASFKSPRLAVVFILIALAVPPTFSLFEEMKFKALVSIRILRKRIVVPFVDKTNSALAEIRIRIDDLWNLILSMAEGLCLIAIVLTMLMFWIWVVLLWIWRWISRKGRSPSSG